MYFSNEVKTIMELIQDTNVRITFHTEDTKENILQRGCILCEDAFRKTSCNSRQVFS
jgi:hypothetical protein